ALARIAGRDRAPDAGARAGDDRDVVLKKGHDVSSAFGFLERDEFRLKRRTTSPSPRSSRGRDERSSLLEGWGEGLPPRAENAVRPVPPHPDRICDAIRPLPASGARLRRRQRYISSITPRGSDGMHPVVTEHMRHEAERAKDF